MTGPGCGSQTSPDWTNSLCERQEVASCERKRPLTALPPVQTMAGT